MRNKQNNTGFDAIRIEGGMISTALLEHLRRFELSGQTAEDYGIEKGLNLKDELGRYWRIAQAHWEQFNNLRQREDLNASKVTVENWLLPLLEKVLGYQITPSSRKQIGERQFPLTHQAFSDALPMVLTGTDQALDKGDPRYGEEGRKRSPAGLVQEYLNAEDRALWAICSNGLVLRLLRDNPAMTRPAYIEIDLQRLFEEDLFVDFTLFWLLVHASRLEPGRGTEEGGPESCYLEQWRAQGQHDGERVLGELRTGVTEALRILGTGFISHPDNKTLRQAVQEGELSTDQFFQELLRLIYRFLFMLTAEDRDLLLAPDADSAAKALYQQGYSISQLRDRARQRRFYDHHTDAWQQLCITFRGFATGQPLLAQPALGGLFAADQCAHLEQSRLANRALFQSLFKLGYFESNKVLVRINYRDMDTEELGSVYESLLELIPRIDVNQWQFGFMGDAAGEGSGGHARKLTGSYYTPDSLVQELIHSALEPVIEQRLHENPADPRQALLAIRVCDPACGSGHFLLAAARRLAAQLAQIEAGADQPSESDYRHALRQVVRHCIYGVDLNPLAVELCRTALWLEAIEPGKPLGFLDAHIQVGNSLVGLLTPELMAQGIPNDAYRPLTGDDKPVATALKKRNKINKQQLQLLKAHHTEYAACAGELEQLPEESLEQIEQKRAAWCELMQGAACQDEKLRADLFTSAFFAPKTGENAERVPTNVELTALERGEAIPDTMRELITELAQKNRFFHWFLAFPEVFSDTAGEQGGFDVMLGNPPWERIKLQEQEFFASRSPLIAQARNKSERSQRIQWLSRGRLMAELHPEMVQGNEPDRHELMIYQQFVDARYGAEGASAFARLSARYPLTGRGDVNLYALFAEHFLQTIAPTGRSGFIVPTGIATDDSTKFYFAAITSGNRLVSLFDFENREAIFPSVHRSYKFSLLTLGAPEHAATLAFFATRTSQIRDPRRRFHLTADEFALINPNTRTCPVFRSERDAELTKKLYRAAPVLIREATEENPEQNPWGIRFQAMFHMSADSGLFHTHEDLLNLGATQIGATWHQENQRWLPLYEAKMVHHYDHRWATYETDGKTSRDCTLEEKQNPDYHNLPRYWVDEWQVTLRTARAPRAVIDAAKKQDSSKLETALRTWAAGAALLAGEEGIAVRLLDLEPVPAGNDLFADDHTPQMREAEEMARQWPLDDPEVQEMVTALETGQDLWSLARRLLQIRRPGYLLGWRDICRATDERTVIAGVIPLAAVGNNMPLIFVGPEVSAAHVAALQANLTALPFDFVARHKVGGTHLNFFIFKQLPVLSPDQYTQTDLDFIVPRVLELTYTSHDLKPFAEDLGYHGEPFAFGPKRRHQLKCELDAWYARLYGLTRDELRYILDPAEVMGEDYPSETFRVLKKNEMNAFGEYRTRDTVLREYDRMEKADAIGEPYISLLYPPPGELPEAGYSDIGILKNDNDARLAGFLLTLIGAEQSVSADLISQAALFIEQPKFARPYLSNTDYALLERLGPQLISSDAAGFIAHAHGLIRFLENRGALRAIDQRNRFMREASVAIPEGVKIDPEMELLAKRLLQAVKSTTTKPLSDQVPDSFPEQA